MVKWRDAWTLELDTIFKSHKIGLLDRMNLLTNIQNSQMMEEVEVKQEVIEEIAGVIKKNKDRFGARPKANKGEQQDRFISLLDITNDFIELFKSETKALGVYNSDTNSWDDFNPSQFKEECGVE